MNTVKQRVQHDYDEAFANGLIDMLEEREARYKKLGKKLPSIPKLNPKEIREMLGISQRDFANQYGIPLATLKNWEQGRSEPDTPTALLLYLISIYPQEIAEEVKKLRQ